MMYRISYVFLLISGLAMGLAVAQTLTTSAIVTHIPSALGQVVPICAQDCVRSAVTQKSQSRTCSEDDLACLCSAYDGNGYTIGERAFACLYAGSCSSVDRSVATQVYFVCSGIQGAVSPTQQTLTVTATSQLHQPTSASSATSSVSLAASTLSTTIRTQASSHDFSPSSASPTALAAAQVPVVETLSDAQVAGIVIAALASVVLITTMLAFAWFRRLRRRLSRNSQPDKANMHHFRNDQRRADSPSAAERIDPRRGSGGVGIRPRPRSMLESARRSGHEGTVVGPSTDRPSVHDMTIGLATTANVPILAQPLSPPRTTHTQHRVDLAAVAPSQPHSIRSICPSRPHLSKDLPQVPTAALIRSGSADRRVLHHPSHVLIGSETPLEYSDAVEEPNTIYTSRTPTWNSPPRARSAPRLPPGRNEIMVPPSNVGTHRQIHPALRGGISLHSTDPGHEIWVAETAPTVRSAARGNPTFNRKQRFMMHRQSDQDRQHRPSIETLRQQTSDSETSSAIPSSDVLPVDAMRPSSSVMTHRAPSQPPGTRASMLSCTTFEMSDCEDETEDEDDCEKCGLSDDEEEAASPISEIRYPRVPRLSSSMIPIRLEQPHESQSSQPPVEPAAVSQQTPPPLRRTASESHGLGRVRSPQTPEYRPYRPGARDTTRYLPGSASTRQVTPGLVSPASQYSQKTDTTASSECPFYYDGGSNDGGLVYQMPQLTPSRKGDEMFLSVG